jgi:hypothetical protein
MTRNQLIYALSMEDIPVYRLMGCTDEELIEAYLSYYPDENVADIAKEADND